MLSKKDVERLGNRQTEVEKFNCLEKGTKKKVNQLFYFKCYVTTMRTLAFMQYGITLEVGM